MYTHASVTMYTADLTFGQKCKVNSGFSANNLSAMDAIWLYIAIESFN